MRAAAGTDEEVVGGVDCLDVVDKVDELPVQFVMSLEELLEAVEVARLVRLRHQLERLGMTCAMVLESW